MYRQSAIDRHRGRPARKEIGDTPEESTAFRLYFPHVLDRDIQAQTYARQQILNVIMKPDGLADHAYTSAENHLSKYVNGAKIPSLDKFHDAMYRSIYPEFKDNVAAAIFNPDVVARIANPTIGQRTMQGDLSISAMARQQILFTLRHLVVRLARQNKDVLGLVDATGRFSAPEGTSNWNTNQIVSLDAPLGSEGAEGLTVADTVAGPASEQPEAILAPLAGEVSLNFPEEVKEHIGGVLDDMSELITPESTPEQIAAAAKQAVEQYAADRLVVIPQLEETPPDAEYWKDSNFLLQLTTAITDAVTQAKQG